MKTLISYVESATMEQSSFVADLSLFSGPTVAGTIAAYETAEPGGSDRPVFNVEHVELSRDNQQLTMAFVLSSADHHFGRVVYAGIAQEITGD